MIKHTVMDMDMVTLQNSARYVAALAVAVLLSQRTSVLVRLVCLGDIWQDGPDGLAWGILPHLGIVSWGVVHTSKAASMRWDSASVCGLC